MAKLTQLRRLFLVSIPVVLLLQVSPVFSKQDIEFFENRIRPVLVEHCYSCHNSTDNAEGELALDWRNGIRAESSNGIAVAPGDVSNSLLLKVIRHEIEGLEMPEGNAPLPPEVIADFEKWIAAGADDPRNEPPSKTELAKATSWESVLAKRKMWWCFQPVQKTKLPANNNWSNQPVDRFIFQTLAENGLIPAKPAERETIIRRLSYALTGLPPGFEEVQAFVNDSSDGAYERLVDKLLASPRFGERWARHWMDLVRYADSHGSEGDPAIPNAYQYRDYLIRAFNNDVPYDQLLREHIAGDLLEHPRINRQLGINESAIGPAHLRFVFHGFAPTDALDEKVRFTDDQINVMTKAFQGLTVSCARCHDHKFDAISQADYFALFGVLGSCRPAMIDVNTTERQNHNKNRLAEIKIELRNLLSEEWTAGLGSLPQHFSELQQALGLPAEKKGQGPLLAIYNSVADRLKENEPVTEEFIKQLFQDLDLPFPLDAEDLPDKNRLHWDLASEADFASWFSTGIGIGNAPVSAGEFTIASDGERIIETVYPKCVITNRFSNSHRGVLGSPRFELDKDYDVWLNLVGGGQSTVRYVVQNYPRDGTVYPINEINKADWYWHKFDLSYWKGDEIHLELATAMDAPVQTKNQNRSWFGIREVVVQRKGEPAPGRKEHSAIGPISSMLLRSPPTNHEALLDGFRKAIEQSVATWKNDKSTDRSALFLNACLQEGLLNNSFGDIPAVKPLLEEYRLLEAEIPRPTRVPGVSEADPFDQPLFARGNHRKPLDAVPRRFLEALDPSPFVTTQSGRKELADAILSPHNPLTSRVIANRIWHYLFGRGIVATPDNFGRLGELPSHPELLDYLSNRIVENNWSIKQTIREIVLSKTWRQDSFASEKAKQVDPLNRLVSHANVRRLDAESIRDSLLFVSDYLDKEMYGPGAAANSPTHRRSVYVQSRRNSLDHFLQAFDSPLPFSTTGRRSETNVPAQSLTLLNDPFVESLAKSLVEKQGDEFRDDAPQRITILFRRILGRNPSIDELSTTETYLVESRDRIVDDNKRREFLKTELANTRSLLDELVDPVRTRLEKQRIQPGIPRGPIAFLEWNFTKPIAPNLLHLHGDAKLTQNGLELRGSGYALTPPIDKPIREKTLAVTVQLENLQQRGGGAITHQDLRGIQFDSIVFGEQSPQQWLAGSNSFARTEPFRGPVETEADNTAVHFAIVYDPDGTIRGYRNGVPFGVPIKKSGLAEFEKNDCQIVFGLRHGTGVSSGRMLNGTIINASFFDEALSEQEVQLAMSGGRYISPGDIYEALAESDKAKLETLQNREASYQNELAVLGEPPNANEHWTRLVHAMFNLKEFIYTR